MNIFPTTLEEKEDAESLLTDALNSESTNELIKKLISLSKKYPSYIDCKLQLIYCYPEKEIYRQIKELFNDYILCLKENNLYEDCFGLFSSVEETKRAIEIGYYYYDILMRTKKYNEAIEIIKYLLELDYVDTYNLRFSLEALLILNKKYSEYKKYDDFYKDDFSLNSCLNKLTYYYLTKDKEKFDYYRESIRSNHPIFIDLITGKLSVSEEEIEEYSLEISYQFNTIEEAFICLQNYQKYFKKESKKIFKELI